MKPGLRLQILLLLGALLVLAFVPLFYAVATYASLTLQQAREQSARALGRAVAGHVSEARRERSASELFSLLEAEIGTEGVEAIGVYDKAGKAVARAGEPNAVASLRDRADVHAEGVSELTLVHGRGLQVVVPDDRGAVVAVLRIDDQAARSEPLVRFVALYTGLVGLGLLVTAYFALTRLIVRPLDQLAIAAQRVAGGASRLEVPIAGARELTELGATLRTMTERLLANEDALRRKVDEVERATEDLKRAQHGLVQSERLASVGRLAAGLAHEIGNPISALMGLTDLLIEGGLSESEQRDFLSRMKRETERIHRILRDLLAFARPGGAQAPGEPGEPGDVEVAVHETAALLGPQRAMQDVELAIDVEPELPKVALGREQLVQVVLNLVLNAADACGAGGHVTLRAVPTERGVRLDVEDDGPGVAPSVAETLFEPFVTTKEVGKGTGLGLAVCRGLVEAAGGRITLDASHTPGARFSIELPAA